VRNRVRRGVGNLSGAKEGATPTARGKLWSGELRCSPTSANPAEDRGDQMKDAQEVGRGMLDSEGRTPVQG